MKAADVTDLSPMPVRPAFYDKKVGLVLQGGGALGSYQAGVYEALASSEYRPDWVAGISIGAINAAIIAGNTPEYRVQRLRSFWEEITASTKLWPSLPDGPMAAWQQRASALTALMFGQPGFFSPVHHMSGFHVTNVSATTRLLRLRARWRGWSTLIGSTRQKRCG